MRSPGYYSRPEILECLTFFTKLIELRHWAKLPDSPDKLQSMNVIKAELILLAHGCWHQLDFNSENITKQLTDLSEIKFIPGKPPKTVERGQFYGNYITGEGFHYAVINPRGNKIETTITEDELQEFEIKLTTDITPQQLESIWAITSARGHTRAIPLAALKQIISLLPIVAPIPVVDLAAVSTAPEATVSESKLTHKSDGLSTPPSSLNVSSGGGKINSHSFFSEKPSVPPVGGRILNYEL
jgi:hypothetical protein